MKRIAEALIVALIALPGAAMAQDRQWDHHRGDRGQHDGRGQQRTAQPAPGQAAPGQPGAAAPQGRPAPFTGYRGQPWQGRRDDGAGQFGGAEGQERRPFNGGPDGRAFNGGPGGRPGGYGYDGQRRDGGDRPPVGAGFQPQGGPRHIVVDLARRDGGPGRDWQGGRAGFAARDRSRDGADWRDHGRDGYAFDDRRGWNRGWRGDGRYDWARYRSANRGVFHLPRYYAPYGWGYGYQRFGIGFRLDEVLFAEQYWIDDPYEYRLPPVDGPYRWVRYYNDALLIDLESGEVVDTVYGIFW